MNILTVSSRQWSAAQEWTLLGTQRLLEQKTKKPINWVVYDKNPDLMQDRGLGRTHKTQLQSNSFRHQSLLPFSAVVIAGTADWTGGALETLYGLIEKHDIPLLLLGIETKRPLPVLSKLEHQCMSRRSTFIVPSDEATKDLLSPYHLLPNSLSSPALFAANNACASLKCPPKVGFLIEQSEATAFSEHTTRHLTKWVAQYVEENNSPVICPNIDDFMYFSTLFQNNVRYSYNAADYLGWISSLDFLVTTNHTGAIVANSLGIPAIVLNENETKPCTSFPL